MGSQDKWSRAVICTLGDTFVAAEQPPGAASTSPQGDLSVALCSLLLWLVAQYVQSSWDSQFLIDSCSSRLLRTFDLGLLGSK